MAAFMIILGLGMNAVRVYAAFTTGAALPLYRMGGIAIGCGVAIIIAETERLRTLTDRIGADKRERSKQPVSEL